MKATDLNITLAANLRAWRIYSQTPSARPTLFVPVALPLLSFVSAQQNINQKKKGPRQKVLAQGRAIVRLAYNTASQVHRLDAFLSLSLPGTRQKHGSSGRRSSPNLLWLVNKQLP